MISGSLTEHVRPWLLPLSSAVIGGAATLAGLLLFRRKDIK